MKIAIGSDHAGVHLKKMIKEKFAKYAFEDKGTFTNESCDYPDIAYEVGRAVQKQESDVGILICGTGIGMSIAANKLKGIRAALCSNCLEAEMSRKHNDANILCMGARIIGMELAFKIVETFLSTGFEKGRHRFRIAKIEKIENNE